MDSEIHPGKPPLAVNPDVFVIVSARDHVGFAVDERPGLQVAETLATVAVDFDHMVVDVLLDESKLRPARGSRLRL